MSILITTINFFDSFSAIVSFPINSAKFLKGFRIFKFLSAYFILFPTIVVIVIPSLSASCVTTVTSVTTVTG